MISSAVLQMSSTWHLQSFETGTTQSRLGVSLESFFFLETDLLTYLPQWLMCVPSESCCPCLSVILCKYTYKLPAHSDPKKALFVSIVCVYVCGTGWGGPVDGKYSETQMSVGDKESVACMFLHFRLYSSSATLAPSHSIWDNGFEPFSMM